MRRGRIDNCRVEDFAGRIDDGNLATCSESGVPAEHGFARNRRLHQELCQIFSKERNRAVLRFFSEFVPDIALDGGRDEAIVRIGADLR